MKKFGEENVVQTFTARIPRDVVNCLITAINTLPNPGLITISHDLLQLVMADISRNSRTIANPDGTINADRAYQGVIAGGKLLGYLVKFDDSVKDAAKLTDTLLEDCMVVRYAP